MNHSIYHRHIAIPPLLKFLDNRLLEREHYCRDMITYILSRIPIKKLKYGHYFFKRIFLPESQHHNVKNVTQMY